MMLLLQDTITATIFWLLLLPNWMVVGGSAQQQQQQQPQQQQQHHLRRSNRGLQEEIAALSPIRHEKFLERCQESSPENITWWTVCNHRLAYNWQAGM